MELMKQALEHTAATQRAATPRVLSESQNWDRTQREAWGKSVPADVGLPVCSSPIRPSPHCFQARIRASTVRNNSSSSHPEAAPPSKHPDGLLWAKTSQTWADTTTRAQARGISWKPKTNHFTKTFQGAMYRKPQIESELPKSKFYVGPMGPAAWQDPHSRCPE